MAETLLGKRKYVEPVQPVQAPTFLDGRMNFNGANINTIVINNYLQAQVAQKIEHNKEPLLLENVAPIDANQTQQQPQIQQQQQQQRNIRPLEQRLVLHNAAKKKRVVLRARVIK